MLTLQLQLVEQFARGALLAIALICGGIGLHKRRSIRDYLRSHALPWSSEMGAIVDHCSRYQLVKRILVWSVLLNAVLILAWLLK